MKFTIKNITPIALKALPYLMVSRMKNILISNIVATGVGHGSGIQMNGLPDHPIEGVRLENIRLIYEGGGTREQAGTVIRNSPLRER